VNVKRQWHAAHPYDRTRHPHHEPHPHRGCSDWAHHAVSPQLMVATVHPSLPLRDGYSGLDSLVQYFFFGDVTLTALQDVWNLNSRNPGLAKMVCAGAVHSIACCCAMGAATVAARGRYLVTWT
jgi:hypothetical protein